MPVFLMVLNNKHTIFVFLVSVFLYFHQANNEFKALYRNE